jgi:hypothetical protein
MTTLRDVEGIRSGASLRMTTLWGVESIRLGVQKTRKDQKVTSSQDDDFAAGWRCQKTSAG